MNRRIVIILILLVAAASLFAAYRFTPGSWHGVDTTVVGRFAEQAGRPAAEPFINTDRGDLLLFLFLLAGTVGGFVAGYCFRGLFPPGRRDVKENSV